MSTTDKPTRRRILVVFGILAFLGVCTLVAFVASPWPGAYMVRMVFTADAQRVATRMLPFAPAQIGGTLDVQYGSGQTSTRLDVFYPDGEVRGTVIWTHGGAWVSGDKRANRSYFQLLASRGFTVVGLNYSYGPESTYPTALVQLNTACAFLVEHADEFRVDTTRIVFAGDSAGAQLASQLATLVTNPDYARSVGLAPSLHPGQLKGVVLHCGVYEMSTLLGSTGLIGWGIDTALWAYTGHRHPAESKAIAQMSTIRHVTADFPAVFISGGNADPLTALESVPMANTLHQLGVAVTTLFWPSDYEPPLPHEYQFHLDLDAAQVALDQTVDFLHQKFATDPRTPPPSSPKSAVK